MNAEKDNEENIQSNLKLFNKQKGQTTAAIPANQMEAN